MWTLRDFMVPPKSGAKIEWLSQTGLPRHTGKKPGGPRLINTLQCCRGKYHPDMVGHDSGGPEGVPRRDGRGRWAVPGSLLRR